MPQAIPIILAATAVAGTATSIYSVSQQNKYNQQALESQQKIEDQRRQAMELDARRKNLEIIRNMNRARSIALSNSVASGTQGGSGLQGGYGQISGEGNNQLLSVNQNLDIGRNIFGLNADITAARSGAADASTLGTIGGGLTSLSNSLLNSYGTFNRIGQGFGSPLQTNGYSNSYDGYNYGSYGGTGGRLGGIY